jgi:hypothetical protein
MALVLGGRATLVRWMLAHWQDDQPAAQVLTSHQVK